MSLRRLARIALHLSLVLALLLPGLVAPARAVTATFDDAPAAMTMEHPHGQSSHGQPCDMADEPSAPAGDEDAGGCCSTAHCDLAVCLGVACLPALPHLAARIPLAESPAPWREHFHRAPATDTPLRPPIA